MLDEPVEEYVTIEAWETESGNYGWRISSNLDKQVNKDFLQQVSQELSEFFLEDGDKSNPVLLTVSLQEKGTTNARWSKNVTFHKRSQYVWFRRKMYQSQWLIMGRKTSPNWLELWWSLEWLYHRIRGNLKPYGGSQLVAATPVAATPAPMLSEQSEGFENGSVSGANVVQLFPKGHKRDQRPI